MYSYQEQHHQTENESTPSVGVPASVIVSSNNITTPAPAVHDSQLSDSWVGQSHSPSPGLSHLTAVVKQVEMPLYVKPHPLVAAAAAATTLGYLTFPHHCSVVLFCISHCFHCSRSCYAIPKCKNYSFACSFCAFLTLLCFIIGKGMIICYPFKLSVNHCAALIISCMRPHIICYCQSNSSSFFF